MEMEHINENTIRVIIGNEDLVARGITFLDLLGSHNEIENFFYSILEEVDVEEEFRGSEAVTFQVLPKGDGLELYISKNMPIDEMDSEMDVEQTSESVNDFIQQQFSDIPETENDQITEDETIKSDFVFAFDNFEQLIDLTKEVVLEEAWTNVYVYEARYYLEVIFSVNERTQNQINDQVARVLEFAGRTAITPDSLQEYGKRLLKRNGLEQIKYYFG